VPMLILESLNVKIVGNGDTQLSLAGSKGRSVSNAMASTNQKTTANSDGVAKPTKKQILHDLKPRKKNHVPIHSSVQIAEATTKPTTQCPFWKHHFNREWQQKKYIEIHENRTKSIHSIGSGEHQI